MRIVMVIAAAGILAGCVTQPAGRWVRFDGKAVAGNPALMQQGKIDLNACEAESMNAGAQVSMPGAGYGYYYASAEKMEVRRAAALACMNRRGYDYVPLKPGETVYDAKSGEMKQIPDT